MTQPLFLGPAGRALLAQLLREEIQWVASELADALASEPVDPIWRDKANRMETALGALKALEVSA